MKNWGFAKMFGKNESWPKGEENIPTLLLHTGNLGLEDEMIVNLLESCGIPCIREYPNNGDLGRLYLGVAGTGVDIFVPKMRLEEARAILEHSETTNDEEVNLEDE